MKQRTSSTFRLARVTSRSLVFRMITTLLLAGHSAPAGAEEVLSIPEMFQIKGGKSSPKEGSPTDPESTDRNKEPEKPCERDECGQKRLGDPVVLTGGKNFIPYYDVVIPGPGRVSGLNLQFTRSYSNQDGFSGGAMKSMGWVSNLDISVTVTPNGSGPDTATIRDWDGTLYRLTETSDGSGVFQDFGMTLTVQDAPTGQCVLKKPFGIYYQFYNGLIGYINDSAGNQITYNYNPDFTVASLTDNASRSLTFDYSTNRLSKVTDPLGREWIYTYDTSTNATQGNLLSVTSQVDRSNSITRTVQYYYNEYITNSVTRGHSYDANNIVAIADPKGQVECYKYSGSSTNDLDGDRVISHFRKDGKEITFWYDNSAGVSTLTEPGKGTWVYNYDVKGLTTYVGFSNGLGRSWSKSYAYDPSSHLMTHYTNALGKVWTFGYDNNFQLISITDPYTNTVSYTTNSVTGKWETMTDRNGHTVTRNFDSDTGTITSITDALTNSITYAYTNSSLPGFVTSAVDRNSHTNHFSYNSQGDLTSYIDGNGNPRSFTYDEVGRMLTATERLQGSTNLVTTFAYDDADRVTKITVPGGFEYEFEYDLNDNLTTITDPLGHETSYTYDALDRLKSVEDDLGHTTTRSDELSGNSWTITDAEGRVVNYTLDEYDRVLEVSVQDGGGTYAETVSEYDEEGNLIGVADANSNVTEFQYDSLNRLKKTIYPDSSYEEHSYDDEHNMTSHRNRAGETVSMEYDANDRLIGKGCPSCAAEFQYDGEGNLTEVEDAVAGTFTFAYDAANQLSSATQPGTNVVSYEYFDNGLKKKLTYPDSTSLNYTYNALGKLWTLSGLTGVGSVSFNYDNAGRRTGRFGPGNMSTTYTLDDADRLTTVKNWRFIWTQSQFSYTLDDVGNRTAMTRSGFGLSTVTTDYTYDPLLYRLTGTSNSVAQSYAYDEVGNRTSVTEGTNTVTYATANSLNQYPTVGGTNFYYSANGNLTNNGVVSMSYDSDNRLTQTDDGSTVVDYEYDWMNRLITKTVGTNVTQYVYDGWHVIAETDGSTNIVRKYVHGPRVDEVLAQKDGGTTYYFLHDGLGSTTEAYTVSGSVPTIVQRYVYDAFGEPEVRDGSDSPIGDPPLSNYLFTGREYQSETGLYNYRNRFYHSEIGRFSQPDPIGFEGGINFYSYVENNPVNWVDPFGLEGMVTIIVSDRNTAQAYGRQINERLIELQRIMKKCCIEGPLAVNFIIDSSKQFPIGGFTPSGAMAMSGTLKMGEVLVSPIRDAGGATYGQGYGSVINPASQPGMGTLNILPHELGHQGGAGVDNEILNHIMNWNGGEDVDEAFCKALKCALGIR